MHIDNTAVDRERGQAARSLLVDLCDLCIASCVLGELEEKREASARWLDSKCSDHGCSVGLRLTLNLKLAINGPDVLSHQVKGQGTWGRLKNVCHCTEYDASTLQARTRLFSPGSWPGLTKLTRLFAPLTTSSLSTFSFVSTTHELCVCLHVGHARLCRLCQDGRICLTWCEAWQT